MQLVGFYAIVSYIIDINHRKMITFFLNMPIPVCGICINVFKIPKINDNHYQLLIEIIAKHIMSPKFTKILPKLTLLSLMTDLPYLDCV